MLGQIIYIYLFLINVVAFIVYAYNKHLQAFMKGNIAKPVLIMLAVIGGVYGALASTLLFGTKNVK